MRSRCPVRSSRAHQGGRPALLVQLCQQADAAPRGGLVLCRAKGHAGDVHEVVARVELQGGGRGCGEA